MVSNRRRLAERTPVHAKSRIYNLEGFKAGATSLHSVELEEMGDVTAKSLLHLQCHFGMDTISVPLLFSLKATKPAADDSSIL